MGHILLEAEDGPLSEVDGLVNDGSEDLGIIEGSGPLHLLLVVVA